MNLQKKYSENFNKNKKELIDFVFSNLNSHEDSFADLGGVWNVNAAYTFYTIDEYDINSAYLVDTNFTELVKQKVRKYKNLILINENIGEKSIIERISKVDVIFLFDVLLHQVKPNWDEILKMYSQITLSLL